MPLILGGSSATATYTVDNSCRFNRADSAYLQRTVGTPTNAQKYTYSFWIKRCALLDGGSEAFLLDGYADASNRAKIAFRADRLFEIWNKDAGSNTFSLSPPREFSDVSGWYHIVLSVDTTQATDTNRVKLYVNGVQETSLGSTTYPSQDDANNTINESGTTFSIMAYGGNASSDDYRLDSYMSEICFIDGTQYAASDFGEFSEDSPTIWMPKDVSGLTFGDNGFYLDFEDSADLGADASGNSNDFTATNLDATDQATDTPTNNFATFNPLDNYYMGGTFSQGNTYWVTGSSEYAGQPATVGLAAGKWYWEVKVVADTSGDSEIIGIMSEEPTANGDQLGSKATDYGYYANDGDVDNNGSGTTYGDTYTVGDIIGVALDLTNNKIYWSKNSVWQDSGDPTSGATGTGAVSITAPASTPLGFYFPAFGYVDSANTATFGVNFGGSSGFTISSGNADGNGYGNFEYAPPSGYLALCTKNLGSDGG